MDFYTQLDRTLDHWVNLGVDVERNCKIVCMDKSYDIEKWALNSKGYEFQYGEDKRIVLEADCI